MSHNCQGQGYAGCRRAKGPHQVPQRVPLAVAAKAVKLYTQAGMSVLAGSAR